MNLSWTITDKRYEHQPWKHETFRGYFTDIRRAARKSLPRKPNKDLCGILGLALSPRRLEHEIGGTERRLSESATSAPVSLKPVVIHTVDRPPDIITPEKESPLDKLKAILLCRNSRTENCSKREKTVFGFAIYFAIIIFILLIIVLILSTSLSRLNDDGESTNSPSKKLATTSTFRETTVSPSHATVRNTSSNEPPTSLTAPSSTLSTSSRKSTVPTSFETLVTKTPATNSSISPKTSSISTVISVITSKATTSIGATTRSSISTSSSVPSSSSKRNSSVSPLSSTASSKKTSVSTLTPTRTSDLPVTSEFTTKLSSRTSSSPKSSTPAQTVSSSKSTSKTTSEPLLTSPTLSTPSSSTVNPRSFPTLEKPSVSCTSRTCLAANESLSRVDFDVSPCVDFYEFSCGTWSDEWKAKQENGSVKNIPESLQEELRQGLLLEIKGILQRAYREDESFSTKVTKRLYQSCIESNVDNQIVLAMQEVHTLLDPLGMQRDGSIQNSLDALLRDAVTRFEVTPFFKLSPVTTLNEDGTKVYALKIQPPSVFLDHSEYIGPVEMGKESFSYVEGLSQVLHSYLSSFGPRRKRQTAGESSTSTPSFEETFNRVVDMYYIEANISRIVTNTTFIGDEWYSTLSYTYAELRLIYPFINWEAAVGQTRNFLVRIVNFGYFRELNNLWKTWDEEDIKLYVFMSVLAKRIWTYMKLPFRKLLSNVGSNDDMVFTEIDCINIALNLASEEIHALYIGQFTQKVLSNRLKLTNLENKIGESFQKFVSAAKWIQPDLERAVTSLANNLKMQFSGIIANIQQTRNITGGSQSFLSLAVELHRQKYEVDMTRLGSEVKEVMMDWTSTRPYFDEYFSAIGIPTGLTVYLGNSDLSFDLYGYVGMVMAEEFIKVLTGPMKGGSAPQWWGTSNMIAFDTVSRCFSDQLTSVQNKFYDLGNVIISNGAFQIIDQVYFSTSSNIDSIIPGSTLTQNMIFITNIAQLQCRLEDGSHERRLIKDRVNNAIMNNVILKQMFGCPDVSPMVTNNTCSLFL